MEEQLITKETAVLGEILGYPFKTYPNVPTQSLLQKWLREVHNIYVESYHDLSSDGKSIQYYTSWGFLQQKNIEGKQNVNGWYDEYNDWKKYEEALEFGLQEALKLIEDGTRS